MQGSNDKAISLKLKQAITSGLAKDFAQQHAAVATDGREPLELKFGRSDVYDKQVRSLIAQYERKNQSKFENTLTAALNFVNWVVKVKRAEVVSTTWNAYRSAIMAIMPHQVIRQAIWVPSINGKRDVEKQKSSLRVKRLTDEQYTEINSYLTSSTSKYAKPAQDLLFVMRKTGVRPVEVLDASLMSANGYSFLKVKSVKKENRRYEGELLENKYPYRYIPLIHLDDTELQRLAEVTDHFRSIQSIDVWDKLYEGLRFTFLRTVKNLGLTDAKSSYSFYSARQQFSADLKVTPLAPSLISKIMSHSNEKTIRNHYARKAYGKPLFSPDARYEAIINELFEKQA